jgi:hypothetical protein
MAIKNMSILGTDIRWNMLHTILVRVIGLGVLLLGAIWLYTFLFTDFRAHQSSVMIPLAVLVILFALGLISLLKIFVILSFVIAIFVFLSALYIQVASLQIIPFLFSICVISIIYMVFLAPPIIRLVNPLRGREKKRA